MTRAQDVAFISNRQAGRDCVGIKNRITELTQTEQINFALTNRIPRRFLTVFMGWFSKLENPVICWISIKVWSLFSDDLKIEESKQQTFRSLHDCFTRELKPGARPICTGRQHVISPCDGIVGAFGRIEDTRLFQIKGAPYSLHDLFPDTGLIERYRNGIYITLRLRASMYHRFHAPADCRISSIDYISGDAWNVNPTALKRIEKLYCKNERAIIDLNLADPDLNITLVPVAAILVAGIKLHCLPEVMDLRYRGPNRMTCNAAYRKGDELGYFQHGSTIIVFASNHFSINPALHEGLIIKMGQSLLTAPHPL